MGVGVTGPSRSADESVLAAEAWRLTGVFDSVLVTEIAMGAAPGEAQLAVERPTGMEADVDAVVMKIRLRGDFRYEGARPQDIVDVGLAAPGGWQISTRHGKPRDGGPVHTFLGGRGSLGDMEFRWAFAPVPEPGPTRIVWLHHVDPPKSGVSVVDFGEGSDDVARA